MLDKMASSDVPVLLRGETGVGKEVLARKLHARSSRGNRPFVKLNCAALPSELIESELFGYERGAFTGAFKTTPGKFEMANGGTLLLDEIGDMDFKLQAKLLHVLQDREFHRLGSKDVSRVDVRVMAATHCDLEMAIVDKRFREDLFYRLNIIEIDIPPLRERKDEILSLSESSSESTGREGPAPSKFPQLCSERFLTMTGRAMSENSRMSFANTLCSKAWTRLCKNFDAKQKTGCALTRTSAGSLSDRSYDRHRLQRR